MDQHKIIQRLNTMLTHSDYNEIDDFLNIGLLNDPRSDHDRYLTILHNLNGGLYGDSEFNEDHMEIKIDGSDSRTGNPIIFDWYFMFEPPII